MITHRPLTPAEALRLHEQLKTTPNILGYTVRELLRFRNVLVAEIEGEFAGTCISKDLHFGWTDIALLYVLPEMRGRGLGSQLYTMAWQQAEARGRHIYTLSRSPEVIHLMERFGMKVSASMWRAPLAVHLHMNRHMSSLYRLREAIRKSKMIQESAPLLSGTKRHASESRKVE